VTPGLLTESVRSTTSAGSVQATAGSGKSIVLVALLGAMSATGASAPIAEPLSLLSVFAGTSSTRIATTVFAPHATTRTSDEQNRNTAPTTAVGIAETLSDVEAVNWVKANSGLTVDQLGRVFGVSRRAVHLWASGGRMNATNARVLREFAAAVEAVHAPDPDAVRAALLAVGIDGKSAVDRFRAGQRTGLGDISGTPFKPEELLGALHGEVSSDA
jgi:hypothetical protein